ncbi:MAG: hypothetical protein ACRD0Z_02295 [Acidimicrobiales bacterium]
MQASTNASSCRAEMVSASTVAFSWASSKAQFSGDDQLGGGQRHGAVAGGGMVTGEPLDGDGISPQGRVARFLGPAAQLVEVGMLEKQSGHGVSLLRLPSAAQAEEGATARLRGDSEWTQSFPRTRWHPPGATADRSSPPFRVLGRWPSAIMLHSVRFL